LQKRIGIASRKEKDQIGIGKIRSGHHTKDRILLQSTLFTIEEEEEDGSQVTV